MHKALGGQRAAGVIIIKRKSTHIGCCDAEPTLGHILSFEYCFLDALAQRLNTVGDGG